MVVPREEVPLTPRDILFAQIYHDETHPVPYVLGFEGNVAEDLDAYYGGQAWRGKLTQYMVGIGGVERRKYIPVDDNTHKDLFGSLWRTDRRPYHLVEPALHEPSLDGYVMPSGKDFVPSDLLEQGHRLLKEHPETFSFIGMGWGLWETSWGIRGFENALMDCVAEPFFYEELLDHLTDHYLEQIELCRDLPADAVLFGDDWGDQRGVIMGPERWRRYFKPRYARIYEAVHAQGKICMSHCCGSVREILPDILEIGLDVLESCQPEAAGMNPYELKREYGDRITFWGCLGSQSILAFGSVDDIHREVIRLRAEMGRGGGFILAPAKALQPGTPVENAAAVVEAFTGLSKGDLNVRPT